MLLLVAGVAAAGSAFLGRNRLQNQCDGAALAASDAADVAVDATRVAVAGTAARQYLGVRAPAVAVAVTVQNQAVTAVCRADVQITFGSVFLTPTLGQTVSASSRIRLRYS